MKKNKLYYNTIIAIINQIIVLLCNFILPRQILLSYGSDVNGLVTSITQFLGFITLMDMGIGAVVQSSLYKPLLQNDEIQVSKILKSARNFFNKIGKILIFYVIILCLFYPKINNTNYNYEYIIPLIIAISISSITQYFFGIVNQLLLNADQKVYIQLILNSITLILNTVISLILMKKGFDIQIVKFSAAIIFLIKPMGMALYVKKHYKIDGKITLDKEPIKQKWNGIAQHIAAYVLANTDVLVLTFFSTMKSVSIYNVYYLVVAGIRQFITTLMTGVDALFGNLYASQSKVINTIFNQYEWLVHTGVSLIFTITALLICPFIGVYTSGVKDVNYIYPVFGYLLVMAFACYCIRLPYNTMVLAAGHYKETQTSAIVEAAINVILSVALVYKLGIYGIAIGTLVAMIYRTIYLAYYLKKAILYRPFIIFIKHIFVDLIIVVIIFFSNKCFIIPVNGYLELCFLAFRISSIALIESIAINSMFYKKEILSIIKKYFFK